MKILFISDQFYPRTSADSEQIVSSLSALGKIHSVTLLSAAYRFGNIPSKKEIEEYYHQDCSFSFDYIKHLFRNIRGIEKIIFAIRAAVRVRNSPYDLVYTRNIPVVFFTLTLTKIPVLFESYRPWPARNFLSKKFFQILANDSSFLGVVLHSKYAGKSFLEAGFTEPKLLLAHNAFNFKAYKGFVDRDEIRNQYKIPKDRFLVTYSGRVNKAKGVERLFRLAEEFSNVHFLIIGSEKEGEIENEAKDFTNIQIIGWKSKSEVFDILRSSDVLYIPPTTKSRDIHKNTVLPLKTFMYKASGVPILAPDMEDIKEVLSHKENAYLVEPDNFEEEVKGLQQLINDKELRIHISEKARKEMMSRTWDRRAIEISEFLKRLLK